MNLTLTKFEMKERNIRSYGRHAHTQKSHVYVTVSGEGIWDDMANRTSRPYNLWRPLIKEALAAHGVTYTRMNWSQYAGCGCPCSPGFILTGHVGHIIWVEITADETQTADPITAEFRRLQLLADATIPVGSEEQKSEARDVLAAIRKVTV